jgi:hypothetical protein
MGCSNGYKSPDAVYQAAKSAAENKNYHEFCTTFTPESQGAIAAMAALSPIMMKAAVSETAARLASAGGLSKLGGLANIGIMAASKAAKKKFVVLDTVLEKHGFTDEKCVELVSGSPQGVLAAINDLIKDKPGFTADVMMATERISGISPLGQFGGELRDVKITNSDTATGTVVHGKKSVPIHFKKTVAGWLLNYPDLAETIGFLPGK